MRTEEARPASDSFLQILSCPRSGLLCETLTDDPSLEMRTSVNLTLRWFTKLYNYQSIFSAALTKQIEALEGRCF
jgi:hypothetical protein